MSSNNEVHFYPSPIALNQGGLDGDGPVTSAHENTHGVNSKLRRTFGGNNYFISKERMFVRFPNTPRNITLRHVAQQCEHKGGIYNLYLIQAQRWWNDTPLYVFDEWSAYMNGSYQQLFGANDRNNDHSIACMLEMAYYSYVATIIMPTTWESKLVLQDFWMWMALRSLYLSDVCRQREMFSDNHRRWREILMKRLDNATVRRYNTVLQ